MHSTVMYFWCRFGMYIFVLSVDAPHLETSAERPLTSPTCSAIMNLFRRALGRLLFGSQFDAAVAFLA